jgi:L-threonylcarbamoyladenylate synthase
MMESAVAAVLDGLVVGLPTDTVYGVGVDPFDFDAVARLYELKGRPAHKPVGLLVATVDQAAEIADLGEVGIAMATENWPGALTLVVRPKVVMADWVGDRQRRTLGVRVPDHAVARELLALTGPLAVTSANESGGAETMSDVEARAVFGDRVAVYLEGTAPGGEASTVVDLTSGRPTVIRPGPVRVG